MQDGGEEEDGGLRGDDRPAGAEHGLGGGGHPVMTSTQKGEEGSGNTPNAYSDTL